MKPYLSFAITCQHQLYVITTYSEANFSHSSLKKSTFFPCCLVLLLLYQFLMEMSCFLVSNALLSGHLHAQLK